MHTPNILLNKSFRSYAFLFQYTLAGIFLFTSVCKAVEDTKQFTSGIYEGLMVAIDTNHNLKGYFSQSLGGAEVTCSFYLEGKKTGEQFNVTTWNDKIFPGWIKTHGKEITLKVEHATEHPGCGMALLPVIENEGIHLTKTFDAKWIGLKLIKVDRAVLYSGPTINKKTKSYFIKEDILGVLATTGEWVYVEFPRPGKKSIKGWVRSGDVEDLQPPQKK